MVEELSHSEISFGGKVIKITYYVPNKILSTYY